MLTPVSSCRIPLLSTASEESVAVAAAPIEAIAGSSKPRTPKVKAPQVPKVNKMAPKAKKEATMVEGAAKIGIEYKKDADFPKWYQQVERIIPFCPIIFLFVHDRISHALIGLHAITLKHRSLPALRCSSTTMSVDATS